MVLYRHAYLAFLLVYHTHEYVLHTDGIHHCRFCEHTMEIVKYETSNNLGNHSSSSTLQVKLRVELQLRHERENERKRTRLRRKLDKKAAVK